MWFGNFPIGSCNPLRCETVTRIKMDYADYSRPRRTLVGTSPHPAATLSTDSTSARYSDSVVPWTIEGQSLSVKGSRHHHHHCNFYNPNPLWASVYGSSPLFSKQCSPRISLSLCSRSSLTVRHSSPGSQGSVSGASASWNSYPPVCRCSPPVHLEMARLSTRSSCAALVNE